MVEIRYKLSSLKILNSFHYIISNISVERESMANKRKSTDKLNRVVRLCIHFHYIHLYLRFG